MPTPKRKVSRKKRDLNKIIAESSVRIVGATKGRKPAPAFERLDNIVDWLMLHDNTLDKQWERLRRIDQLESRIGTLEATVMGQGCELGFYGRRIETCEACLLDFEGDNQLLKATEPEHTGDGFSGGRPLKGGLWARAFKWLQPKS